MDVTKLLKHTAWANQQIFGEVAKLPDAALDAYIVNPEWTVREIIHHTIRSTHFYGYRLAQTSLEAVERGESARARYNEKIVPPEKMSDLKPLLITLAEADAVILTESHFPEGDLYLKSENGIIIRKRSTIVSQVVHHATEHRAQMVAALEYRGYTTISLDDYDIWAYSDTIGE